MKKCPMCAEEVQDEAVKCRHCGAALISERVKRLAPRYGTLTEQQRKQEWERLSEQEKKELPMALEALPKPDAVKTNVGTLIAVIGVLIFLWALVNMFIGWIVIGILITSIGMALKRKGSGAPARAS